MPDPSRRTSRSWSRLIAHCLVVGLLAAAATTGVTAYAVPIGEPGVPAPDRHPIGFDLVGTVSAAGSTAPVGRTLSVTLQPDPAAADPLTALRMPDPTPTPAPTPTPRVYAAAVVRPVVLPAQPPPSAGSLLWPVPGGVITQYYSAYHLAIDIATSAGKPVIAADAGIVTWAGWKSNGGGNVIVIDHGEGVQTGYNHLGGLWVTVGQSVAPGEAIAPVGCTGLCTGPHVHFQVIVNGQAVNPLRYL